MVEQHSVLDRSHHSQKVLHASQLQQTALTNSRSMRSDHSARSSVQSSVSIFSHEDRDGFYFSPNSASQLKLTPEQKDRLEELHSHCLSIISSSNGGEDIERQRIEYLVEQIFETVFQDTCCFLLPKQLVFECLKLNRSIDHFGQADLQVESMVSDMIDCGKLKLYRDVAEQSSAEALQVEPEQHSSWFKSVFNSVSRTCSRALTLRPSCTCSLLHRCRQHQTNPDSHSRNPQDNLSISVSAGDFLIHVGQMQSTAEKLLEWTVQRESPFLTQTEWRSLLRDTFHSELEAKLFKRYLKEGRNQRKSTCWLWTHKAPAGKYSDLDQTTLIKIGFSEADGLDWTIQNLLVVITNFRSLINDQQHQSRVSQSPVNFLQRQEHDEMLQYWVEKNNDLQQNLLKLNEERRQFIEKQSRLQISSAHQ